MTDFCVLFGLAFAMWSLVCDVSTEFQAPSTAQGERRGQEGHVKGGDEKGLYGVVVFGFILTLPPLSLRLLQAYTHSPPRSSISQQTSSSSTHLFWPLFTLLCRTTSQYHHTPLVASLNLGRITKRAVPVPTVFPTLDAATVCHSLA